MCFFNLILKSFSLPQIWVMAFCVTFVFTVTLSVFPAVTADVKTIFPGKWGTMSLHLLSLSVQAVNLSLLSCVGGLTVTLSPQNASSSQCAAS